MNLDIVKILGYGLSGLAAIFVLASMTLITKESGKEKPNIEVLKTIRLFMIISFIAIFIVGIFSLPSLNKKNEIANKNEEVAKKSKELSYEAVIKLAEDLNTINTSYNNLTKEYNILKKAFLELEKKCKNKPPGYSHPKVPENMENYNEAYFLKIDTISTSNPEEISDRNIESILNSKIKTNK